MRAALVLGYVAIVLGCGGGSKPAGSGALASEISSVRDQAAARACRASTGSTHRRRQSIRVRCRPLRVLLPIVDFEVTHPARVVTPPRSAGKTPA